MELYRLTYHLLFQQFYTSYSLVKTLISSGIMSLLSFKQSFESYNYKNFLCKAWTNLRWNDKQSFYLRLQLISK